MKLKDLHFDKLKALISEGVRVVGYHKKHHNFYISIREDFDEEKLYSLYIHHLGDVIDVFREQDNFYMQEFYWSINTQKYDFGWANKEFEGHNGVPISIGLLEVRLYRIEDVTDIFLK